MPLGEPETFTPQGEPEKKLVTRRTRKKTCHQADQTNYIE